MEWSGPATGLHIASAPGGPAATWSGAGSGARARRGTLVLVEYRGVRPRLARDTLALRVLRPSGERLRTEPGLRWGVDPASVTVVAPRSER